ncbi:MAG: hypothetical protein NXI15_05035 [Gammaproteobacteria bacterium]|nr:hypothetical protein [Gammaproteobacteria bacterium]
MLQNTTTGRHAAVQDNQERAKRLVPTIILTVLSMIQALALEIYWTRAVGLEVLWSGGWDAIIAWMQLVAGLVSILIIWVVYVSFVLRFTWLPSLAEMIMPFLIGILEFAAIAMMHPQTLALWIVLVAVAFLATLFTGHQTVTAARREPANAYFFAQLEAPTWRNYRESLIAIALMLLLVAAGWLLNSAVPTIIALMIVVAALTYQFYQIKHYWLHSITAQNKE